MMMQQEQIPLVDESAPSPSGSVGRDSASSNKTTRTGSGGSSASSLPRKLSFNAEYQVTNGYDELLHSLLTEGNHSFKNAHFQSRVGIVRVSLGGVFIGAVFGVHLMLFFHALVSSNPSLAQWCLYVFAMVVFHYMEFLTTAAYKPRDVSYDSYLLNHSKAYIIAAVASWVEFWLELWLLPRWKGHLFVICFGVLTVAVFQTIRSLAMITAGRNFNHIVQDEAQVDGHDLVSTGVYQYLRHPAYFGWFWWSICTQLLLGNPLCICAYAFASWKFFESRIYHEERYLYHDIFPNKYGPYCKTAIIGIPLIKGYVDTLQE